MGVIGYLVAVGSLLVLLPVLPVVALVWLYDRLRPTEPKPEGVTTDAGYERPTTEPPEGTSMA